MPPTRTVLFAPLVAMAFLLAPDLAAETESPENSAWDRALVTDRPDAAESSVTVGKGRFQIETGLAFSYDASGGGSRKVFGLPTLLRYGFVAPVELRIEGPIFNAVLRPGEAAEAGLTDIAVGTKIHLYGSGGAAPSLGLLFFLTTPTGTEGFSAEGWAPTLKGLADFALPAGFSLGTNAGLDVPPSGSTGVRFARFLYAASLSRGVPGVEQRLRLFIEGAGSVPLAGDAPMSHQFDTGLTFLVTPDLQLDAVTQIGLTAATDDVAAGLGLSWRL